MPRTKKADQKKGDDKNTAPVQGAQGQAEDTTATQEAQGQAEGTTATQEAQGQAEDTATAQEVQEQGQEDGQDAPEPEGDESTAGDGDTEQSGKDAPERDLFAGIPNPCVYCGPTVRGVARQYTTYQGGIPDTLRDFIKEHPEARELIVSTAQFPGLRKRLDTPGTDAAKLYKRVKSQL